MFQFKEASFGLRGFPFAVGRVRATTVDSITLRSLATPGSFLDAAGSGVINRKLPLTSVSGRI